jgi:hypothetical protein
MLSLFDQARYEKWFGGDVSDIPPAQQAAALTSWDAVTGWLPEADDGREQLEKYCGTVIDRLVDIKSVDIYLAEPIVIDGEVEVYNLDILLAIGAGISRELDHVRKNADIQSDTEDALWAKRARSVGFLHNI